MKQVAELYGLVLMGGHSRRMGRDKSELEYHGVPQREYVADLLSGLVGMTYLSGRGEQLEGLGSSYPFLADSYMDLGPLGGILTAFQAHPDKAWLVMAVDMPKMDASGLEKLVRARRPEKLATAYLNQVTQKPEPLAAIWEPAIFPVLLAFLAENQLSPQKILMDLDIQLVPVESSEKLLNVNKPSDFGFLF